MYNIVNHDNMSIIHIEQKGIKVDLSTYGASIFQIQTPDKNNKYEDLLLAYQNASDYLNNNIYLNATIGPISGRIKEGKVYISNQLYQFNKNDHSKHTLHGGNEALSYMNFDYSIHDNLEKTIVNFTLNRILFDQIEYHLVVTYTIFNQSVIMDYHLESNKDFFFNLTNHAYFNLSGNLKSNIKNHFVKLRSNNRHQLDSDQISTMLLLNELIYDFTDEKQLGHVIESLKDHPYKGIDDIFYFPDHSIEKPVAVLYEPESHRQLDVYSTCDHLVFYTHNNTNNIPLKHLNKHPMHYGVCFECQKAPYGFKKNQFSKSYKEQIIYKFSLR